MYSYFLGLIMLMIKSFSSSTMQNAFAIRSILLVLVFGSSLAQLSPNFYSNAGCYCICNDGLSNEIYQMNIDYACQNRADCIPIMQNGLCFQTNTVKDRCNFAVNSYYQRNGRVQWSCNFANTTTVTQAAPPATSKCAYPSASSPRDVDPPEQQLVFHFSLSIKIILPTGLFVTVTVLVACFVKLFQRYRLNEGENQPAETENHLQSLEGGIQFEIEV